MDCDAPPAWKNVVDDVLSEDYEILDDDTRNEINRWKSQRICLIQRRMQQELESKLEEMDIEEIKPSKPFVKVLVTSDIGYLNEHTVTRSDCNDAFVTIWNPSTEQLDLLRTGAVIRIKNLDAKGPRFEGLRQFSGGPSTPILPLSTFQPCESGTRFQRQRKSIFSLHLQSKRYLEDSSNDRSQNNSEVSVVGILLDARKHEICDDWFVYLTDKSQLLLKIHCVKPCDKLRRFLINGLETDIPVVLEFRRILVMKFDDLEQCTIVKYSKGSTFCENPCCHFAETLLEWSMSDDGYTSIAKQRSYLNVGVRELSSFQAHRSYAVGYIAGLFVLPSLPELIIKVDCGASNLYTWRFPIALIQSFISTYDADELREHIALNEDEEVQAAKLTKIGQIFGSRKNLFRFNLRTASTESNTSYIYNVEVLDMSIVDANALASMYAQEIFL